MTFTSTKAQSLLWDAALLKKINILKTYMQNPSDKGSKDSLSRPRTNLWHLSRPSGPGLEVEHLPTNKPNRGFNLTGTFCVYIYLRAQAFKVTVPDLMHSMVYETAIKLIFIHSCARLIFYRVELLVISPIVNNLRLDPLEYIRYPKPKQFFNF